jgi:hypothetical protein
MYRHLNPGEEERLVKRGVPKSRTIRTEFRRVSLTSAPKGPGFAGLSKQYLYDSRTQASPKVVAAKFGLRIYFRGG